jgi:hypothetical protein
MTNTLAARAVDDSAVFTTIAILFPLLGTLVFLLWRSRVAPLRTARSRPPVPAVKVDAALFQPATPPDAQPPQARGPESQSAPPRPR